MSAMGDVLAEHLPVYRFSHELKANTWACSTPRCEVEGEFSAVIAHQAAALSAAGFGPMQAARAEAWDEGKVATLNDPIGIALGDVTNPYHTPALAERGEG